MVVRLFNPLELRSFFLFGARGTGKTYWLKEYFPETKAHWFNLLNPALEERFLLHPELFYEELLALDKVKKWIVIDEIQKVPKILDMVHLAMSEKLPFNFILTGSSARKLKRGAANLLAGRANVYSIYPLTHSEWGSDFQLEKSLNWGDLPELIHLNSNAEKSEYLKAYAHTYLKEEIQMEQLVRKLPPFRKFLEVAAQMNGKVLNFSKIAKDVGVDTKTIQSYYNILEETLIGFYLPAYSKSLRKQQRLQSKFYFFDLGVTRALSRVVDLPLVPSTSDYGHSFEHFIIKEILAICNYRKLDYKFSYFATKEGKEIDLVIERPGKEDLFIEIKSSVKVDEADLTLMKNLKKDFPKYHYLCVSQEKVSREHEGITMLPWRELFKVPGAFL